MTSPEAVAKILTEFARAEQKFPGFPTDIIHAAAIPAEECGELVQAALQFTYEHGTLEQVEREAVQLGAMALRFLLMLDQLEARPSVQVTR